MSATQKRYSLIFLAIVIVLWTNYACKDGSDKKGKYDIEIENVQMRLLIGSDGKAKSLIHKPTGEECLTKGVYIPIATVTQYMPYDPKMFLTYPSKPTIFRADTAYIMDEKLIVAFEPESFLATIRLDITDDYIVFMLEKIEYVREKVSIDYRPARDRMPEIDEFTLLQLPVRNRKYFGEWLNVSWDDKIAVGLLAADPYTKIDSEPAVNFRIMKAGMESRVKMVGAGAALVTSATEKLLDHIEQLELDRGLPPGAQSRRAKEYKYSYYSCRGVTPENIDEHLLFAKKGGFHTVMIYYPDFATSMGHFPWRPEYKNGMADLQYVTEKIKKAGMIPGFHFHYSKAAKDDPYVSPVPDHRLNLRRIFTLSDSLDNDAEIIKVEENPMGCTLEEGRRFLKFGNELVTYKNYTTTPPFQFTGCERGALHSRISHYEKGFKFGLLDVDTWPLFVRFDQNTGIQDEVAERIGNIWAKAGFQFAYFDGAEDVPFPYWYNVPKAQLSVYNALRPAPVFSEGAAKSHFSWHILTRGNAFDTYDPEVIKEATLHFPLMDAKKSFQDFTSINFGWVNYVAPSSKTIGMQPDMFEFICKLATAWDCPISLVGRLDHLKSHPRTDDNLEVIRRWEKARINGLFSEKQKEKLRKTDQEHILMINDSGEYALFPYKQISGFPVDSSAIRAFIFEKDRKPVIVYWHAFSESRLKLEVENHKVVLYENPGGVLPTGRSGNGIIIPVGKRRFLQFDLSKTEALKIFLSAQSNYVGKSSLDGFTRWAAK